MNALLVGFLVTVAVVAVVLALIGISEERRSERARKRQGDDL